MLLSTAYLPPISWCSAFWKAEVVALVNNENYQKGSFRNRAHIAGPNGMQRLSIPLVKGKHQQTPIRAVRISYEIDWQRQHWRSICTAYGNAPYFEHYVDELRSFYQQRHTFLFDFNLMLMEWVLVKKMGWKGALDPTPSPSPFGEGGNMELRAESEGTLAKGLVVVERQGALLFRPHPRPLPEGGGAGGGVQSALIPGVHYPQVFENKHGFIPDLSILDLLFCCGKYGSEILEKWPDSIS
jgi:hypothetical protein